MAENKKENQEPEIINEEATLAMVKVPLRRKIINGVIFVIGGAMTFLAGLFLGKRGNDDDSDNDKSDE